MRRLAALLLAGACHRAAPPAPDTPRALPERPATAAPRCAHTAPDAPAPTPALREVAGQLRLAGSTLHASPDDGRAFELALVAPRGAGVTLSLTAVVPAPRFAACEAGTALVADEVTLRLEGRPEFEPASDGASAEVVRAAVPEAVLAAARGARCVRLDVCGVPFPLHARQVEALSDFAARVAAGR